MSRIYLTDTTEYKIMDGAEDDGVFSVKISKNFPGWEYRVMDFKNYENSMQRPPEIIIPENDYNAARKVYDQSTINDRFLRSYEGSVLVHSTTHENWLSIKKSGVIKSWSAAMDEGDIKETEPIGSNLCDPLDYRNYVMLGNLGPAGEIVVASKQKGKLSFDLNQEYIPGVRIYLDAGKLAEDGLLIRDGLHVKVFDRLFFEKYSLMKITPDNFKNHDGNWTPVSFSKVADELFLQKHRDI